MKKSSMRDVARKSGCALCTVSRALAGSSAVSRATAMRIRECARQLGYHAGTNPVVAIAVTWAKDINHYEIGMLAALQTELDNHGLNSCIVTLDNFDAISRIHVDGVISMVSDLRRNRELVRNHNFPLVCINNYGLPMSGVSSVNSDNRGAMLTAVNFFRQAGHRRIGMVMRGGIIRYSRRQREKYFSEAVDRFGVSGTIYSSLDEFDHHDTTALLLCYEGNLLRELGMIRQRGIAIPDDVSVITWEIANYSEYFNPPLTTLGQDYAKLAAGAVAKIAAVLKSKDNGSHPDCDLLVPYRFFRRGSVAAPAVREK